MSMTFQLNGVDVSDRILDWDIQRTFGQAITQITVHAPKAIDSLIVPDTGQTLNIWRNSVYVFSGEVILVQPNGPKYTITGNDKIYNLVKAEVTKVYDAAIDPSAGKISEIFKDLVTTYGGMIADGSSVQDSGTLITLSKYVCNHADVFDVCKALADAIDWQFYYRPDTNKVYFEPLGFIVNTQTLTVGVDIAKYPEWQFDTTQIMNDITVWGATQLTGYKQFYNGTGAQYTFTLPQKPASVTCYVSGVLKIGGAPGATSGSYDYTIDYENKQVTFLVAPGVGTGNVEIDYQYAVPTPVNDTNSASITQYGDCQKTLYFTDIKTVADARARVQQQLLRYSQPFVRCLPKIIPGSDALNVQVGRKITVIDPVNNLTEDLIVNVHDLLWPQPYDSADMGDKTWRLAEWGAQVEQKIQKLQSDAASQQDLLQKLVNVGVNAQMKRVSMTVKSRGIGTTWITGHPDPAVRATPHRSGNFRTAYSTVYNINY